MEIFKIQLSLLKLSGLQRFPSERLKVPIKVFIFFNFLVTFLCILSSIIFVFKSDDILSISESMAPTFTSVFIAVKYIVFCLYFDEFYEIMVQINELNEKWTEESKFKDMITKANKFSDSLTKFLRNGCVVAGLFYVLKPLLNDLIDNLIFDVKPTYELPFRADFIFDTKKSPGYEIAYFIQVCSSYFLVVFTAAGGGTFCCYCLNIAAHFEILREIVNHSELEEFVKYHQKTILLVRKLSKLYKPIIFTEFLIVGIVLCVTGVQILMLDDFAKILAALLHSVASSTDVFIYSYGSQKVLDSAMSIGDEVFKLDKNYIFVIMMSRREMKFDAGLFYASFNTLSKMLSRTMSFITLLMSLVK